MTYKLSKFVGRDQLPGDQAAFDRLNRVFASSNARLVEINGVPQRRVRTVDPAARRIPPPSGQKSD
jgi:hypothetical protein